MSNQLREAQNSVLIEGVVIENGLDYRTIERGRAIGGNLIVRVAADNDVPVNFFSAETKVDGGKSKVFDSLVTIMEQYKSAAKHSMEEAERVKITGGRLESNEFYSGSGQLISTFRIRSNFVNRVTAKLSPGVSFQVEIFVQGITDEVVDDEPTGRVMIKGIVPMYGGRVSVLNFFVEDANGIRYIQDNYSVGDTVKIAGTIRNEVQEVTKAEEMEFGDDIVTTYERTKRELIVTRGSKPYEENTFDPELIKQAMVERETQLNNLKEKATKPAAPKADTGFSGGKGDVPF